MAARAWSTVAPECPSDTRRPLLNKMPNEIERPIELRRQRDDADTRRRRDRSPPECRFRRIDEPDERSTNPATPDAAGGFLQACRRLRALIVRIDEVAFQVRRQDAGAEDLPRRSEAADASQDIAKRLRAARHSRRTKGRHAILRKPSRDIGNSVMTVERVNTLQPMHVDVDEARAG